VRVERINAVLDELRGYWPVTLRQLYYRLVAAGDIDNHIREYKTLSRLLTSARYNGLVDWESIEDRSRATLWAPVWLDTVEFFENEMDQFMQGYRRDLLQSQDEALEVWVEKDALSRVIARAAHRYGVLVVAGRGFSSTSYLHQFRLRVEARAAEGKPTRILYFGDLDPSGWEMLPAMMRRLWGEMKLEGKVSGVRCALTPEQVDKYQLKHKPDALKDGDPRAGAYRAQFGDLAVELDALPPDELEQLVRGSILAGVDRSKMQTEQIAEMREEPAINLFRDRATTVLHDLAVEVFGGAL